MEFLRGRARKLGQCQTGIVKGLNEHKNLEFLILQGLVNLLWLSLDSLGVKMFKGSLGVRMKDSKKASPQQGHGGGGWGIKCNSPILH